MTDRRVIETPDGLYVVTYGCGVGGMSTADGGYIEYEDHQPNCEHGVESWAYRVAHPVHPPE